ncbi:hypothetical protein D7030_03865 [Flavobacteriaceae bacterium AU392]|nr:hypothetical protein D1817_10340 [Flavobacteriaceae bacterium]RKM85812.1 hypothetical protein D7030_03865 [Flavobacteriaceae bacterium AU392]
MNKNWRVLEIIISLLQIIFGIVILVIILPTINKFLKITFDNFTWEQISIYKLISNFLLPIFLSLLCIISGILLLRSKLSGWIIGVSFWSIKIVSGIFTFYIEVNDDKPNLLLIIIIPLLFAILLIC